eukprot:1059154-Amorphochlora_amoeboformis.AAC.1
MLGNKYRRIGYNAGKKQRTVYRYEVQHTVNALEIDSECRVVAAPLRNLDHYGFGYIIASFWRLSALGFRVGRKSGSRVKKYVEKYATSHPDQDRPDQGSIKEPEQDRGGHMRAEEDDRTRYLTSRADFRITKARQIRSRFV